MKAFVLEKNNKKKSMELLSKLKFMDLPIPKPKEKEILLEITNCGICHTEIDKIEGRIKTAFSPIVIGHQIIGKIVDKGTKASKFTIGTRVGVGWIAYACGNCNFCLKGQENLCKFFLATGKDINGGYAEYMTISEEFACFIPESLSDNQATPLLCAGSIGLRSLTMTKIKNYEILGILGFGASGHIILKFTQYLYPQSPIFVFARNYKEREFAQQLGASWIGDIDEKPPENINVCIDTTPVWKPGIHLLKYLKPGGSLIINAIRKEDFDKNYLLQLNYNKDLWLEKSVKTVANVTRKDIVDCLKLATKIDIKPEFQEFPFKEINNALLEFKIQKIHGAKILKIKQ